MHGSLSPDNLKEQCYLVGRKVFNSRHLGRLLWSLVLQESKAGTEKSENGGVCSISHAHYEQMIKHSQFYRYEKRIITETGLNIRFISFDKLATCPELSLIFAAAWFMANASRIPKDEAQQTQLLSRYWAHFSPSIH
ncbi:hypothetical protein BCS71_25705 [Vibrio lentus]|uniref:hypothetical protein n=1 Tax=Vibrio lentus TaxID=136468 RepID=UPI000C81C1C5|nr:hypothetical protein [Vibrio lentus]PMI58291.1 hypothetical protein BCU41_03925 [Vibrio lentus]